MAFPAIAVVPRAAQKPPERVEVHRFTREEYERIAEKGGFSSDRRVECEPGPCIRRYVQSGTLRNRRFPSIRSVAKSS
jgi:hypothetical protein